MQKFEQQPESFIRFILKCLNKNLNQSYHFTITQFKMSILNYVKTIMVHKIFKITDIIQMNSLALLRNFYKKIQNF
jgi:hypothetical protein